MSQSPGFPPFSFSETAASDTRATGGRYLKDRISESLFLGYTGYILIDLHSDNSNRCKRYHTSVTG